MITGDQDLRRTGKMGAVVLRRAVPDSAGVSTRRVVPALQSKRMEAHLKRAVTACRYDEVIE
jgi:hypothetical protein